MAGVVFTPLQIYVVFIYNRFKLFVNAKNLYMLVVGEENGKKKVEPGKSELKMVVDGCRLTSLDVADSG